MALGALLVVQAVLPWSDTSSYWEEWLTRLVGIGMGVAFFVVANRPRVQLRRDLIVARGIFFSKQIRFPDLMDVRASYYGITLSTRDGRNFTTTFVGEKSNLSRLMGRRSRGDDLAIALLTAARPDLMPDRRRIRPGP